jgi:hypothetical protein
MYWPDFLHYAETLDPAMSQATASNTLFWAGREPKMISWQNSVSIAYDELISELKQKSEVQVLFVASHFTVPDVPEATQKRLEDCAHPRHCEFFVLNPAWPQT